MKKKGFVAILLCACIGLTAFAAVGCGGRKKIDVGNRVELKVYNYNGGVGKSWLDAVVARYEDANKDKQFASGKVGVVVNVNNDGISIDHNNLFSRDESVFFNEGFNYLAVKNQILDISDVLTTPNAYDNGNKIEDKLSADMKAYLQASDGESYYALPHYQSYSGVMYNREVFDDNYLYFVKDVANSKDPSGESLASKFVKNLTVEKSVGPDGVAGTDDDGLPSSVDEFIDLCEYMKSKGVTPFAFYMNGGAARAFAYKAKLYDALWVNLEGYDGAMAQFSFDSNGTPSSIVTDFSGNTPITQDKVITKSNVLDVYQQESKYHALRMAEYVYNDARNSNEEARAASGKDGLYKIFEIFLRGDVAMMLDGSHWLNEVSEKTSIFNRNPEYKSKDVRFMPLPVQGTGTVAEKSSGEDANGSTVINISSAFAFVNANTESKYGSEVLEVAKDFLKFCYSDESLQEFTVKSSVTRDVKYSLSEENYGKLTPFAKSIWNIRGNDTTRQHVVNPISADPVFINNPQEFEMHDPKIWYTLVNSCPAAAFGVGSTYTAKEYFLSMGAYHSAEWWDKLNK